MAELSLLLAVCGFFTWFFWNRMPNPGGDTGNWLLLGMRAAQGEWTYGDFAWQWGPLIPPLLGAAFRLFSVSYSTASAIVGVLSTLLVLAAWFLARRLVPRSIALATALTIAVVGATDSWSITLFSLYVYSPGLISGAAGMLLFLAGVVSYIQSGRITRSVSLQVCLGCSVALLSKQEFIIAAVPFVLLLALLDRRLWFMNRPARAWLMHYARFAALAFGPAALAYFALGSRFGFRNLFAGLTLYGVGGMDCPWWPTGIGLFAGAALAGCAVFATTVLTLTRARDFRRWLGGRYLLIWLAALAGLVLFLLYLPVATEEYYQVPFGYSPSQERVFAAIRYAANPIFAGLLILWGAVAFWLRLWSKLPGLVRARAALPPVFTEQLLLITAAVGLASRSLFGDTTFGDFANLMGAARPLLAIAGPYLLLSILGAAPGDPLDVLPARAADAGEFESARLSRRAVAVVLCLTLFYAGLRLYVGLRGIDRSNHVTLHTASGAILVTDPWPAALYDYVLKHSSSSKSILDFDRTGMAFATQRRWPLFFTWFWAAPDEWLNADYRRVIADPPAVVIASSDTTLLLERVIGNACACPKIIWRRKRSPPDPRWHLPVGDFIAAHYRPAAVFGGHVVYVPE